MAGRSACTSIQRIASCRLPFAVSSNATGARSWVSFLMASAAEMARPTTTATSWGSRSGVTKCGTRRPLTGGPTRADRVLIGRGLALARQMEVRS